jgi:hypothetical protein
MLGKPGTRAGPGEAGTVVKPLAAKCQMIVQGMGECDTANWGVGTGHAIFIP